MNAYKLLLKTLFGFYVRQNSPSVSTTEKPNFYKLYLSSHIHTYHLVTISPWPLLSSISAFLLTFNLVLWFHHHINFNQVLLNIFIVFSILIWWWVNIIYEATYLGLHTKKVVQGLKIGVILFIVSEIMFFFSLFWAFFHGALSPSIVLGSVWPPIGIIVLNPLHIPLLNTLILLVSGVTLTLSHYCLFIRNYGWVLFSLLITILLAIEFTIFQLVEYYEALFYICDGFYGSIFFFLTGFHGLHVMFGTIFLIVCFIRFLLHHFSPVHHAGFEFAIWYWHFVDVVWLCLYVFLYCWSAGQINLKF